MGLCSICRGNDIACYTVALVVMKHHRTSNCLIERETDLDWLGLADRSSEKQIIDTAEQATVLLNLFYVLQPRLGT